MLRPFWSWRLLRSRFLSKRRSTRGAKHWHKQRSRLIEPLEIRKLLSVDISALPLHRVLDNSDAAYSESGTGWQAWSDSGAYQGDFRYHAAGDGSHTAAWTFDNLDVSKTYQLFATWKAESNRASDAPFSVLDGSTVLGGTRVNQQFAASDGTLGGRGWESLGVYATGTGSLTARLSDDAASGYVIADAVCLAEVPTVASSPGIVDDGDTAYAESGTNWLGWSESGAYQGDFRYHAPGTGTNGATWTFDGLDSNKTYQVLTTWSAASNRATNSPFTVLDDTTALATVRLNQQFAATDRMVDNRGWESLGVYQPSSGKLVVRLSDDANGFVIADAVRVVEVTPAETPPSVIDEGDTAYAESGSSWLAWSESGAYQGDFRYHAPGTGANGATWTFDGLPRGEYQVYTTWSPASNRATNSPFSVLGATTAPTTVRLDQQSAPDDAVIEGRGWASLGTYVALSGSLTVRLSDDDANGFVIADAVRVVPVNYAPTVLELLDAPDPAIGGAGLRLVWRAPKFFSMKRDKEVE